jgi:hypothetical protein
MLEKTEGAGQSRMDNPETLAILGILYIST